MPQARVTDKQGKSAKWQARRHEIVDVSAKVFAERGYHATSTTELCEANGIGKGALYYYIGSKEELLAAIHVLIRRCRRRSPARPGSCRCHRARASQVPVRGPAVRRATTPTAGSGGGNTRAHARG